MIQWAYGAYGLFFKCTLLYATYINTLSSRAVLVFQCYPSSGFISYPELDSPVYILTVPRKKNAHYVPRSYTIVPVAVPYAHYDNVVIGVLSADVPSM